MGPQSMMKKLDNIWIGMGLGVLGAIVGFFGYAILWSLMNETDVSYFVNEVFLASDIFKDKIITISVLFNVILFWICLRKEYYELGKGVIAVLLVSVPIIIYFY